MGTLLKLKAKSLALEKNDMKVLCEILGKVTSDQSDGHMHLKLSGGREEIIEDNIDKFINARWPIDIDEVNLSAYSYKKNRGIRFSMENGLLGLRYIEVSGSDTDWVSARMKEIEDFLIDHRNFHWLFHLPIVILFWFICLFVTAYQLKLFGVTEEVRTALSPFLAVLWYLVFLGLSRVFPFIFVDTGRTSTVKILRKFLCWIIPIIIVGLVVHLIVNVIL